MKLTCMVIIAVLFLTACQLITADLSSDEYHAVRSIDEMHDFKGSRATPECSRAGCKNVPCCSGLKCTGPQNGPVCQPE
uniref:Conotoxin Di6.4 n=1 Tax=Conus distans TaxID=72281 RepID=M9PQH1_CONDI|nr:conotoxin Di6.4 [Conus distans]